MSNVDTDKIVKQEAYKMLQRNDLPDDFEKLDNSQMLEIMARVIDRTIKIIEEKE